MNHHNKNGFTLDAMIALARRGEPPPSPFWHYEYALEFPGQGMPTPPSEAFVRNAMRLYPGAKLRRRLVGEWTEVREESLP